MINEKTHAAQKCPLCKHDYCPGYTELAVTQLAADLVREKARTDRLFDLVRQRSELHTAGLSTGEEYADLLTDGLAKNSVKRLHSQPDIDTAIAQAKEKA